MKPNNRQNVDVKDLGFGSKVTSQSQRRLLNRDGSFNVNRFGLSWFQSLSLYHLLLRVGWIRFYALIVVGYLIVNMLFAIAFYLCGPDALLTGTTHIPMQRFAECFFFSIQTLTTLGYGRVSPAGIPANIIASLEALSGVLSFAFATGLSFARFSRPNARVLFSKQAIIAPYRGMQAFEFRIINARSSQIIEMDVKVVMSKIETTEAGQDRRFYELSLERQHVPLFPLNLTIVHPIDSASPLTGMSHQNLLDSDAEFLILITGVEETFSQQVHTRTSYKAHEVVAGVKFSDMYVKMPDGAFGVDVRRLHEIEPAAD